MPQERAALTRLALLDAAIDSLVELGYAATTTTVIAERAGVSRGAMLHHFPTRASLLAAAVEHLLDARIEEYRRLASVLPYGQERLPTAIDVWWSMYEGPTFIAWVELWVAARTDPDLATAMRAVDQRFLEESRRVFAHVSGRPEDEDGGDFGLDFASTLMGGIALERLIPQPYQRKPEEFLEVLKLFAEERP